jgi:hypothetical protein
MDALQRATEALDAFLKDEDQRVAALKGAWGVGKSFFVRNFVKERRETLPPFIAFASVFGLRTLEEVRSVVTGCIEATAVQKALSTGRSFSRLLSQIRPSVAGIGFNIPDLSNAAFWYLAKNKGILVVLDDLERAHDSLSLDELLGFASSLTENSKAKVLLIFNEDVLNEERSQKLSRYREKVIDAELEYRPNATELVTKFLPMTEVHEALIRCLNASGGPNIRLILRAKRAIRDVQGALERSGLNLEKDDLAQIARVMWFYHVSPRPVTIETLKKCYTQNFLARSRREENSQEDKEIAELADAGGLQLTDLDELVVEYLRCGYLSDEALANFVREETKRRQKGEYQRRSWDAYRPWANGFRAGLNEVVEPVEKLLDDYADKIDLGTLRSHCDFLSGFGRDTTKWWVQHVKSSAPSLDPHWLKEYLAAVSDPTAQEILKQRQAALVKTFDAKATIRRIVEKQSWHPDDIAALNLFTADYYREWLRTEKDEDFLSTLRGFLRICNPSSSDSNNAALGDKLVEVLREIAAENPVNERRVYVLLGVSRPVVSGSGVGDAV